MRTKEFNQEVLFADERIVKVGSKEIEFLKKKASYNIRQRMRLCTHRDIADRLHEMLIVHQKDTYVRPHKHQNKIESFHIIEGAVDVILFDDDGNIIEVIRMGDYSSGSHFYYRISDPYYHTLLIKSDVLVFHETTNGPFNRSDTIFAPWAPEESDLIATNEFMTRLTRFVDAFKHLRGEGA